MILERTNSSVNITCTAAYGHPEPKSQIYLNETILVKSNKTYIIPEVNNSHIGYYTCVAVNIRGNASSDPKFLPLVGKILYKTILFTTEF